jgi:hypothetical protein
MTFFVEMLRYSWGYWLFVAALAIGLIVTLWQIGRLP